MKIDLTIEIDFDCDLTPQGFELLANDILAKLEIKKPHATLEVFLVDNDKIRQINKKYRDKDEATDVLSFPQESFPKAKEETLGTIFIALEFAKKENISCQTLFVHGLLHLLGYDHDKDISVWNEAEKIINRKVI